ncbi:MAG: serine--tRNA ligase [Spirochaetota bacterium]|nr:MAG: serine--tRNA ligase [Spirochaetota bacterium]
MVDIKLLREDPELFKRGAEKKGFDVNVAQVLNADKERRNLQASIDRRRRELGLKSNLMKKAEGKQREKLQEELRDFSKAIKIDELKLRQKEEEFEQALLFVPNPPLDDVPVGKDEADNVEISKWGEPPKFSFESKDHVELGLMHGIMDIERGVKVSGTRSYYLKAEGALLENALMRYALDMLVTKGYTPFVTPVLVKEECMVGSGFFPTGREDSYWMEKDELFLIGTSEVTLVSYHMDEILEEDALPVKYAAYTTCFRREAGSYGKDVRGLFRVHQFQKIEQVVICRDDPDVMQQFHSELMKNAEDIVQSLGIAYRVVEVCTGEMGMGQVKKHDIECWMPGRGGYGETHSCSSFADFQARRSRIRYRAKDGNNRFPYTLNNTAAASPRLLVAIIENFQNEDGSITIPDVLVPYMNGKKKIG